MTTLKVVVCEAQALRVKFGEPVFVKALLGAAKKQTKATSKHVWNEELLFDVTEDTTSTLALELHTTTGLFAKTAVDLQDLEDPTESLVLPLKNAVGTTASRDGTLKVQLGVLGVDDAIPVSKSAQDLSKSLEGPALALQLPVPRPAAVPPVLAIQVVEAVGVKAEGNCYVAITCGSLTKNTAPKDSSMLSWNETLQFGVPVEPPLEISAELLDDVDTRGEGSVVLEHVSQAPVEYTIDLFAMVWRERTKTGQVKVLVHKISKTEGNRTPELPDCASTGALSSLSGSSASSRTDLFRLGRYRQSPTDIHISVLVMKANDLDPSHGEVFVKFTHKDISTTTTPRDASEPVWNEVLKVVLPSDCTELLVELCGADGPKGEGTIPSAQFTDEPLLSLDLNTFFWHRRFKVATLQLSLRRLPTDVCRSRTASQGELCEIASHLGLPSGQPLSPRHLTRAKSLESNLLNAPTFSKAQSVPWIIVTTPEDNESAAPLLVNCMLHVEVLEVVGLKKASCDWLYVKATYGKHTRKTQAASLLDGDIKADLVPFHETLVFAFAGHQQLQFTVVDIIRNTKVASAVLNPSRIEFANSSHNVPLTPAGGEEPSGALLNVDLQLVSKQQKSHPTKQSSRDPIVAEMDLRNKDQKITELEVRMEHLQSELKRYRELERVMAPLQEELKQKEATINELRRLVASGESQSMSVLLVTIGHGTDLPTTCNLHVRLQYKAQVVKSSVRDTGVWDEPLTVEIDAAEYSRGWTEEEGTLLVQIFERDTCLGAGTIALQNLNLQDDSPPTQMALALQQEFWHKLENCGTLHLAVALRLKCKRPAFLRNLSNLPQLNVLVIAGIDLKAVDDLHVQLVFDDQVKKTQVLDETYHPVWNETLTFFINPEDPCEELHVEAYSSDTSIGKGTVILSELDDEDGEDPIVEVQMFQAFLHHRTPAGAVRVQIGIHMNTFNAIMESRRDRILKLEDTVLEKDAEIERLRQQLAVKNDRLGKLEQVVRTTSAPVTGPREEAKTPCVFWFTVLEAKGLRTEDHVHYYARMTFDGASQRTRLAPGSCLRWDEPLRFESDLETLDDELELTIFHDGRVSGSIGTGVCNISDLEFNEAFEDIEVALVFDDRPAGTLRVRVQCQMGEDMGVADGGEGEEDGSSSHAAQPPPDEGCTTTAT